MYTFGVLPSEEAHEAAAVVARGTCISSLEKMGCIGNEGGSEAAKMLMWDGGGSTMLGRVKFSIVYVASGS